MRGGVTISLEIVAIPPESLDNSVKTVIGLFLMEAFSLLLFFHAILNFSQMKMLSTNIRPVGTTLMENCKEQIFFIFTTTLVMKIQYFLKVLIIKKEAEKVEIQVNCC